MSAKAKWFNEESMSAWERVKKAMANDWEQTKADLGVSGNRDMDQDVDDTLKQAAGSDDAFENHEQAFRFGHAAKAHYGSKYNEWNDTLRQHLKNDYDGDYEADEPYIRHSYGYKPR